MFKDRTSYYQGLYTANVDTIPLPSDLLPVPSPFDAEEAAHLFPVDPTTGQLRDLLSQILNADSPLVRDSLMSKLEVISPQSSALKGVDDATKLQLLKPRSVQSLSEMADYAKFVGDVLEDLNVVPSVEPTPPAEPTPPVDPTPPAE